MALSEPEKFYPWVQIGDSTCWLNVETGRTKQVYTFQNFIPTDYEFVGSYPHVEP